MVYKYLMDDEPAVVPPTESSVTFDPCLSDYKFNRVIMGHETVGEIRSYFLKTTPIYFRGSARPDSLTALLSSFSRIYEPVQDYIRHLRVYLRCDTFLNSMQDLQQAMPDVWNSELVKLGEMKLYNSYESRLTPLRTLPFYKYKIKLEICAFYDAHEDHLRWNEVMGERRHKHNILEGIKPTYFYAKQAGADISVRFELFGTGDGTDVSWELDLDAEKWAQVMYPT
jgi:hypothetical protein